MPSGSKARTFAPAARRGGRIARLGLSRMSSVFGLKVRPGAARLPPAAPPATAAKLRSIHLFSGPPVPHRSVPAHPRGRAFPPPLLPRAPLVVGEPGPAIAGAGMQELAPDPPVEADPPRHV